MLSWELTKKSGKSANTQALAELADFAPPLVYPVCNQHPQELLSS